MSQPGPVIPSGCPRAMAPPFGFTCSASSGSPSARRFRVRYTPKHASWRSQFDSRQDLTGKIENFVIAHDTTAKSYRWTYDGSPLKAA